MSEHPLRSLLRPLLHWFRRFQRSRRLGARLRTLEDRPHVLVVADSGIGNAILATPLIQAIKIHWPASRVSLLTRHLPLFRDWALLAGLLEPGADVDPEGFDHIFVTYDSGHTLPEVPQGIPVHRVRTPLGGGPFTRSEAEYDLEMLRRLGYRGARPPLYAGWSPPDPDPWPVEGQRVVVAPCGRREGRWSGKRWPGWGDLIERLVERGDRHVVVLGGPEEEDVQVPDRAGVSREIGTRSLDQAAGILRTSHAAAANDCGLAHLADALQVPHVVVFGPTDEVKNGPLHAGTILTPAGDGRPSQVWHGVSERGTRSIEEVGVDRVLEALERILPEQPLE